MGGEDLILMPRVTPRILTGALVGPPAALPTSTRFVELTNIGMLFAFVLVAIGMIVLRHTNPDAPRPFRTPLVPDVRMLAVLSCGYLMFSFPGRRGNARPALGLVVAYGYRHSKLRKGR